MPIYDRVCPDGHQMLDLYEKINTNNPPCKECGKESVRTLLPTRTGAAHTDEIPGGIWIKHGLCNEDGTPRKYYSKSEMAKEAKRRGMENIVRHTPEAGSDKSKHTVRWV